MNVCDLTEKKCFFLNKLLRKESNVEDRRKLIKVANNFYFSIKTKKLTQKRSFEENP